MHTRQTIARTAGVLYLLMAATGGFSMLYLPTLVVAGDAAATARNLADAGPLFRLGVASGLVCQVLFVFLALALHRLFADVNRTYAMAMVALVIAAVPVAFLNMLNHLAAWHVLNDAPYLAAFGRDQVNALAMLFLNLHGQGLLIVQIFWGLWLVPLGLLVIKAGFMPATLGVLVIVAGAGYVIDVFTLLLLPADAPMVSQVTGLARVGELPIIFWLLIKGVRTPKVAPA